MRCLTDEQIESLATRPDAGENTPSRRHADACPACSQRLQEAEENARLVGDIREFRERRAQVRPLIDGLPATLA